jgi:cytochrome c oxidase subunit 3
MMVLAIHYVKLGKNGHVMTFLALTITLGLVFLGLKALEYYIDYQEFLIPGWRFRSDEWVQRGLRLEQVPHVKLFLLFYWIMTGLHAVHVIIGITVVSVILILTWRGCFSPEYYSPVDVTVLYWHFVDIVWLFLWPMLYLLGTHTL